MGAVKGRSPKKGERVAPTLLDLRRITIFKELSDQELADVQRLCDLRTFAPKARINLVGDLPERAFFVLAGACRLLATAPTGASITMYNLAEGDAVGIAIAIVRHDYGHRAGRIICECPTSLITIKQKDFRKLAEQSSVLSAATFKAVCALHAELYSRFYELATLDTRGRLLAELLRMSRGAERIDGLLVLRGAPTHADLGDQIGAGREAVTRHLLELQKEGIIEAGRREITIKNLKALRHLDEVASGRRMFFPGEA